MKYLVQATSRALEKPHYMRREVDQVGTHFVLTVYRDSAARLSSAEAVELVSMVAQVPLIGPFAVEFSVVAAEDVP